MLLQSIGNRGGFLWDLFSPQQAAFPREERLLHKGLALHQRMTLGFALGVALSATGLKLCGRARCPLLLVAALIFGIVSKNKKEVAAA